MDVQTDNLQLCQVTAATLLTDHHLTKTHRQTQGQSRSGSYRLFLEAEVESADAVVPGEAGRQTQESELQLEEET